MAEPSGPSAVVSCEECGDPLPGTEYQCPTCRCCSDCCDCPEYELFDADELGLDPEEDDERKYG